MNEFITPLDIVKGSHVTDVIWKQELNFTEDNVKLKTLIDAYIMCVPKNYRDKEATFKDFYDDVKNTYFELINLDKK